MEDNKNLVEFGKKILHLLWSALCGIYSVVVITKIWALLIMGFMGLPALPFAVALGVRILWTFLTHDWSHVEIAMAAEMHLKANKTNEEQKALKAMKAIWPILYPSIIWFSAWLWSLFL